MVNLTNRGSGIMTITFPAGPPRIYTASRQLIGGDDFNNLSGHIYSGQSLAALGTTQATATPINSASVEATLANSISNGGLLLPPSYVGAVVCILNNNAGSTKVYPFGITDVIQNGATGFASAQAAVSMNTGVSAMFTCIKKGFWQITKFGGP